jgi:hypothetical protein
MERRSLGGSIARLPIIGLLEHINSTFSSIHRRFELVAFAAR